MGYFSLDELKDKDGAKLTDEYELKKGYWTDPCVEDQFRLVVHYANTNDQKKRGGTLPKSEKSFVLKMVILRADLKKRGLK
jgi:hypothetical protein